MQYGDMVKMMLEVGDALEEIANDGALRDRLTDYAAAVKDAYKRGLPAETVAFVPMMAVATALMKDHTRAMTRLICYTQGITEKELIELNAEETLEQFAKTIREVLRPFFTLSASMA